MNLQAFASEISLTVHRLGPVSGSTRGVLSMKFHALENREASSRRSYGATGKLQSTGRNSPPTVQITITVPLVLRDEIAKEAKDRNTSISRVCRERLARPTEKYSKVQHERNPKHFSLA